MNCHLLGRCRLSHSFPVTRTSSHTAAALTRTFSTPPATYTSRVFQVSEEVIAAVNSSKPVVALETTIYTHGFPYPDNVSLAMDLESIVRINGAIPATVGILNGIARVGLSNAELVELASAAGKKETKKVSRRDLPFITGLGLAGNKMNGGTTISGTMVLAHMAGIQVFGTGGLGGVHRGGHDTMDISADLTELGRTPVTVISSGPKAFLSLSQTLEFLETQGVMVGTFADGRVGDIELPAFYSRDSGIRSPFVVQDEKEAAAIIYARKLLGIQSGIFMANPIPEKFSIPKAEIDVAIEEALQDAEKAGAHGSANTPFILARIKELTKGSSIPANRALIESNVRRASQVAVELAKLTPQNEKMTFMPPPSPHQSSSRSKALGASPPLNTSKITPHQGNILVAGSIAVDLSCDYLSPDNFSKNRVPIAQTSNPAAVSQSIGGVGHNVATAAHRASPLGSVRLLSLVADDLAGKTVLADMRSRGMDTSGIITLPQLSSSSDVTSPSPEATTTNRTAQYVAINSSSKSLHLGMADMSIIETPRDFNTTWSSILTASLPPASSRNWFVLDANWNSDTVYSWFNAARKSKAHVAFEPVSVAKSARLFPPLPTYPTSSSISASQLVFPTPLLDLCTPNAHELAALHATAKQNGYFELQEWWEAIDRFGIPSSGARDKFEVTVGRELADQGVPQMMVQLLPFCRTILTKLGSRGVVVGRLLAPDAPELLSAQESRYVVSRGEDEIGGVYLRHFPALPVPESEIVSVNGAGDTFLGVLVAGLARGLNLDRELVDAAQQAAVLTLGSKEAVSPAVKGVLDSLVKDE